MNDFQITTHVSPPHIQIGRPRLARWQDFKETLEKAKALAKDDWASLKLPDSASVLYALRLARAAGFRVGVSDKANEIKVLYVG